MYGDIICRSPTSTDESLIYSSTTAIFNCVQIAFFPRASLFCGLLSKCAVRRLFFYPAARTCNFLDAPSKHRLRNAERVVRCDRVTSMLTMSPSPPGATIHPPPLLPCRPQSDAAWSSSPPCSLAQGLRFPLRARAFPAPGRPHSLRSPNAPGYGMWK